MPAECLLGRQEGECGGVVLLGQVAENDAVGASVVVAGEVFGGRVIGQVADPGQDALLDGPRVGAILEHLEVVVGFEQEDVGAAEGGLDVGGHVAEISGNGHTDAFGGAMDDEAAGVGGVVRDGEGGDAEVADLEVFTRAEVLDVGELVGWAW